MSFQPRRKLLSDFDCGFSLFAIMNKQTGSQRVGLVEGDTHSCGAANTGAGSCWGEGAGGNQASCPIHRRPASMCLLWCLTGASCSHGGYFVYPPRETQTSLLFWGSQRSGAAPLKLVWSSGPDCDNNVPFTHTWSELAGQKTLSAFLLNFFHRSSHMLQYLLLKVVKVCYWQTLSSVG